jgi:hypothetical protein
MEIYFGVGFHRSLPFRHREICPHKIKKKILLKANSRNNSACSKPCSSVAGLHRLLMQMFWNGIYKMFLIRLKRKYCLRTKRIVIKNQLI